jgi:hypothetical protein
MHVSRGRNRPVTGFLWIFQLEIAEKQFGHTVRWISKTQARLSG